MITNNIKVFGIQLISIVILDFFTGLFFNNLSLQHASFIAGFIVYFLIFVAAGYLLMKQQGSFLKNLLSIMILPLISFLITLFNISFSDDNILAILWDFSRPPIRLSALFLPNDMTVYETARYWLDLVSMPLPILYLLLGLQLKILKVKNG